MDAVPYHPEELGLVANFIKSEGVSVKWLGITRINSCPLPVKRGEESKGQETLVNLI
jgi:hypothetical protein